MKNKLIAAFALSAMVIAVMSEAGLCQATDWQSQAPANSRFKQRGPAVKSTKSSHTYDAEDTAALAPSKGQKAAMWERYLSAAETAREQGGRRKAKPYYFEALRQLESVPPANRIYSPKIALLESSLMELYPNFPAQQPHSHGAKQVKIDEEELNVLARIRRLDQYYPSPNGVATKLVASQETFVKADLEKNKEFEAQKSGSQAKTQTQAQNPANTTH